MSLRGVISACSIEDQGGFNEFVDNIKSAASGLAFGLVNFPEPKARSEKIQVEGILQGEIKLNAVNDWKTTLFYGFTDSARDVAPGGVRGSAIIKFASTILNTLGYTLGGTGPASRKMYSGSNLQGFNVQFKWYTPFMSGWQSAIAGLSYLAWPSAIRGSTPQNTAEKKEAEKATSSADDIGRNQISRAAVKFVGVATSFQAKINSILSSNASDSDKQTKIAAIEEAKSYSTLGEIKQGYILALSSLMGGISLQDDRLKNAIRLGYLAVKVGNGVSGTNYNVEVKLDYRNIGNAVNNITWCDWDDSVITSDESASAFKSDGNEPSIFSKIGGTIALAGTSLKEGTLDAAKSANPFGAVANVVSGIGSLAKALAQSFAMNPIPVKLEIYSGDILKYSFSPLVITSFSITASRETIEGEPVILTIDVGFDYYIVNSTDSYGAPKQMFAGQPIFRGVE